MRIQGWSLPLSVAVGANCGVSAEYDKELPARTSRSAMKISSPHIDQGRLELLASIKQRIRSGFYNSDAVIEDLGHGFAQALDPTI